MLFNMVIFISCISNHMIIGFYRKVSVQLFSSKQINVFNESLSVIFKCVQLPVRLREYQ